MQVFVCAKICPDPCKRGLSLVKLQYGLAKKCMQRRKSKHTKSRVIGRGDAVILRIFSWKIATKERGTWGFAVLRCWLVFCAECW